VIGFLIAFLIIAILLSCVAITQPDAKVTKKSEDTEDTEYEDPQVSITKERIAELKIRIEKLTPIRDKEKERFYNFKIKYPNSRIKPIFRLPDYSPTRVYMTSDYEVDAEYVKLIREERNLEREIDSYRDYNNKFELGLFDTFTFKLDKEVPTEWFATEEAKERKKKIAESSAKLSASMKASLKINPEFLRKTIG